MGPKKLLKENEMEEVKPVRVLRARPQVVSTNVDVDEVSPVKEKKVRGKKDVKTEEDVDKPKGKKAAGSTSVEVKAKAAPKPKKVAAKGHKLPDPIKPGEIFIDSAKKPWRVGKSLGSGGFGEVYSATDDVNDSKVDGYKYVMKVEYSTGPLFVEQHFYIRCAKPEHLAAWKKEKKLKVLGLPTFYAMKGQQEHNGNSYRFIIISKFGQDLQHLLEQHKKFSLKNTLTIGSSLLDSLEYIHHCGYVHADLKPANVLLGVDSSQAAVNIVDFGLATRYMDTENNHKDHIVEKKAAHNGTLIYTSCVAHRGAVTTSRICDVEILAYNLLHLVTGSLPWQAFEKTPDKVLQMKEALLKDPKAFMATHYDLVVPDVLVDLFKYIASAQFESVPDYDKLKLLFSKALTKAGQKMDGKLNWGDAGTEGSEEGESSRKRAPAKKKAAAKKAPVPEESESVEEDTDTHFDAETLRYVNTAKRRVKQAEEKDEETKGNPKKKNAKEDKVSVPTQAMLDVMNNRKNKPTVSRKKKVEEKPIEKEEEEDVSHGETNQVAKRNKKDEEIIEESKPSKAVARRGKKAVEKEEAIVVETFQENEEAAKKGKKFGKKEPQLAKKNANEDEEAAQTSGIPTPAMLEYMNKQKNKDNGTTKKENTVEVETVEEKEDVVKKGKRVGKKEPAKKIAKKDDVEPQTSEIPTPAMLQYMNKQKNKDNGAKNKEENRINVPLIEEEWSSGDDEEPSEKKMRQDKYVHALNETYNVDPSPSFESGYRKPANEQKPAARGRK